MIIISKFNQTGNVSGTIYSGHTGNILNGTKYTKENPYVLTGTSTDIIVVTNNFCRVTPGKTYYLTYKSDKPFATGHPGPTGSVMIWLYLLKTYSETYSQNYDLAVSFMKKDSKHVHDNVWKYTIPTGYNMARVRFNTYSTDGSSVTAKFWDDQLIPAEFYVDDSKALGTKIFSDKLVSNDFIEY